MPDRKHIKIKAITYFLAGMHRLDPPRKKSLQHVSGCHTNPSCHIEASGCQGKGPTFSRPGCTALSRRATNFSTARSACSMRPLTRSAASSSSADCFACPARYRALRASSAACAADVLYSHSHPVRSKKQYSLLLTASKCTGI